MTLRHALLFAYVLVCALALTAGYAVFGVGAPVLGLPRPFAYNIGWVLLTFCVLLVFHLTEPKPEDGA